MSLDWILQGRYMGPSEARGNRAYGGEDVSSTCLGRAEWLTVPVSLDASRALNYFFSSDLQYLGGTGMNGSVETGSVNKQAINRVVHFMNNVYMLAGDRIYKYDELSKTWNTSLVIADKDGTATNSIGLYPVFTNNKPKLITAFKTTSGGVWQSLQLNGLSNTWSSGNTGNPSVGATDIDGGILNEIQHNNRIYFIDSDTTNIGWYDFQENEFGSTIWSDTVRHPMDFCTYESGLYCFNKDDSRNHNLHRIDENPNTTVMVGNPIILRNGLAGPDGEQNNAALSTTNNLEARNLLFTDNVRVDADGKPVLWALCMAEADTAGTGGAGASDNGVAWTALVLDGAGNFTGANMSSDANFYSNPFKMGKNQVGAGEEYIAKPEHTVFRLFLDQREREVNNYTAIHCMSRWGGYCGGAPTAYLYAGGGGDFNYLAYWQWNGGGAPGFPLTNWAGPAAWDYMYAQKEGRHRAFPHEKIGGGARSSVLLSDGNQNIDIVFRGTDTTNEDGVMRIFYNLLTTPGVPNGTNVSVKWYYDKKLHAPETQCVPTGTSHGTIGGLRATNIPADSGTLFYFDWHVLSNNIGYGKKINLNGVVLTAESTTAALTDPTDLSGLTFWLEADDETTIDSGVVNKRVSEWRDKSGDGLVSGVIQPVLANRPTYLPRWENGIGGVRFDSSASEFMFATGTPIDFEPCTTFVIYKPGQPSSLTQTIFSISDDDSFYTWDTDMGGPADEPSGTIVTNGEFYSVRTSGNVGSDYDILLSSQDLYRTNQGTLQRDLVVESGAIRDKAKLVWWREDSFQSRANIHPSGSYPSGLEQTVNVNTDGIVTPSGFVNAANTTVGRFTGAKLSGVYPSAGEYYNGTIYEIATYNRTLFDLEVERFVLYASGKYNLV